MAKRGKDKDKRGFWIIVGIIILVIILVIGLRLYLAGIALEPSSSEPLLSPSPASVKDSDGRAVSPNYAAAFTPGCTDLFEDGSCGKKIGVVGDECVLDIHGRTPWLVYEGYATKTSFIFFTSTCSPGQCCTSRRQDRISCPDICLKVCYNELGMSPIGSYDPCAKADGYCTSDAKVCKDEKGNGVDSAHCECKGWTRKSPSSSPSPSP